MYGMYNVV